MTPSVEGFCNALARGRLLPPDEVRGLRQRWLREAGAAGADLTRFTAWLVAGGMFTEYQVGMISRGHGEQLQLGPYRLVDRVGKGRMAGVYKAVHPLGQTVAVKVLPPSKAADPPTLARFQREARMALRLKHPHVVRTFQTGQHRGLHYLVMEYLEGETLEEVLQRRQSLSVAEAVRLVHQALLGLQHLHDEGLVHRDLKPGNLMLVGGTPVSTLAATVKVMDIGLGRALFDEEAKPGFELTNDGDLLGTPEYMAPEQARDPRGVDIRADVYSLGCGLYHALAGRPPFADVSRVRLLVRQATEEPRPVQQFNPAVPDGLQQILDWMLAKDPAKRYPTPRRAAQALQMFLAAGAEARPLEAEPRMGAYLQWLAAQGDAAAPAAPATPKAPSAPRAAPRAAPKPAAAPRAGAKKVRSVPAEVINVELVQVEPSQEEEPPPARASRRGLLLAGIGVGCLGLLAVGGGLAYGAYRLLRRWKATPEDGE